MQVKAQASSFRSGISGARGWKGMMDQTTSMSRTPRHLIWRGIDCFSSDVAANSWRLCYLRYASSIPLLPSTDMTAIQHGPLFYENSGHLQIRCFSSVSRLSQATRDSARRVMGGGVLSDLFLWLFCRAGCPGVWVWGIMPP